MVNFDDLAVGELRAIGRDGGPACGGFFGGDLGKRAGIAIDDKQSAVFAVDAGGAVLWTIGGSLRVSSRNEGNSDV